MATRINKFLLHTATWMDLANNVEQNKQKKSANFMILCT